MITQEIADSEMDIETREDVLDGLKKVETLLEMMKNRVEKSDPLARAPRTRKAVRADLVECINQTLRIYDEIFIDKGIETRLHSSDEVLVHTDPTVLQQVLGLLLDNAVYWLGVGENEPRLDVHVDEKGFTVKNTGPAIHENNCDEIFEANFTTRPDSSGLGLTLARDLLGTIGAQITCLKMKEGAAFRVDLKVS